MQLLFVFVTWLKLSSLILAGIIDNDIHYGTQFELINFYARINYLIFYQMWKMNKITY